MKKASYKIGYSIINMAGNSIVKRDCSICIVVDKNDTICSTANGNKMEVERAIALIDFYEYCSFNYFNNNIHVMITSFNTINQ